MQVADKKLNKNFEKQILQALYQLVADLEKPKEVEIFLNDFLTEATKISLAKKVMIALFLDQQRAYEKIRDSLNVSTSTISEIYNRLGNEGIQLAIKKIKAEEWANKWSKKINSVFARILPKT